MVLGEADRATVSLARAPEAEVSGRVRLTFVEADGDYETRAAEAIFPDEANDGYRAIEMPLVLTGAEAQKTVERWLAEARIARDRVEFAPAAVAVRAGGGGRRRDRGRDAAQAWRIDRVDQGEYQRVEAVRVERGTYIAADAVETEVAPRVFLPALAGRAGVSRPAAPLGRRGAPCAACRRGRRAMAREVAVYRSDFRRGFRARHGARQARDRGGEAKVFFPPPRAGLFDRGPALRVRFPRRLARLGPAERALCRGEPGSDRASGRGRLGGLQFAEAVPVAAGLWELALRLRGQAGNDHLARRIGRRAPSWCCSTGLSARFRCPLRFGAFAGLAGGPGRRPVFGPILCGDCARLRGRGSQPYAPVHLRATRDGAGGHRLTWIRRTRIDGDSWAGSTCQLGEASELYVLRIIAKRRPSQGDDTRRTGLRVCPSHERRRRGRLPSSRRMSPRSPSRFGPGPFRRITIND